VFLKYKTQT